MRAKALACLLVGGCAGANTGAATAPTHIEGSAPKQLDVERIGPPVAASPAPLLSVMRAELDRSMSELRKRPDAPAYYAAYEVVDEEAATIAAEFGGLLESNTTRIRHLDVDVRVGDKKLDSSHLLRNARFDPGRFGRGLSVVPLEDDPVALRRALWLATDAKYKDAVEHIVKVRAERVMDAVEDDSSDDFSEDAPATFVGTPATLSLDRSAWEGRIRALSAILRAHPELEAAKVELRVSAETRYVVTSEGATLQRALPHARLSVDVHATADDGMELSLRDWVDVSAVAKLPDETTLRARVAALADRMGALRVAPVAEPYAGPAILDGHAAGVFFHETFGHRVEGHRQKSDAEGQTFAKKVNTRVMADFINVWDDPTVRAINGIELNGAYPFDDEGIAAQRAVLVEGGIFKGFLLSRTPTRGFVHSNGHGRRAPGSDVVARQANLVVDPMRVHTREELKQMLLDEVKKQGKPYGLRIAVVDGGYTTTSRAQIQAFKVRPTVVFRVFPDGREELVRGVDLEGTPLSSLETILAAANDFTVFNGHCGAESGWVPVSAASPSLLIGRIETARTAKGHDRPPILPPPQFPDSKGSTK